MIKRIRVYFRDFEIESACVKSSNIMNLYWPSGGMVDAGDLKSPPGTRGAGSSPALAIQTNITGVVKYGICDFF